MDRFCVDCAHHATMMGSEPYPFACCVRPQSKMRSRITGELIDRVNQSCASERRSNKTIFGRIRCGPEGAFYTAAREPEAQDKIVHHGGVK